MHEKWYLFTIFPPTNVFGQIYFCNVNDFSLVFDVFTKIDSIDFFLKGMWAAKKQHTQLLYSLILQNKTAMVVSRHLLKKNISTWALVTYAMFFFIKKNNWTSILRLDRKKRNYPSLHYIILLKCLYRARKVSHRVFVC